MKLGDYLGADIGVLKAIRPFSEWKAMRSVEEDLPKKEIWYEFEGRGVEVICDEIERIRAIFLHNVADEGLSEIPFSLSRQEVQEHFGPPSKSGERTRIQGLGEKGPWDRFDKAEFSINVRYELDQDKVDMITLIRADAVP